VERNLEAIAKLQKRSVLNALTPIGLIVYSKNIRGCRMIIKVHNLNKIEGRIANYLENKQIEIQQMKETKKKIDLRWFKNQATITWSEFLGKAIIEEERSLKNLKQ
jgi:hypothetical protein